MTRAIGQPIPRVEDPRLLRGEGRFIGDLRLPGALEAVVVRSPHAHARIERIDGAEAMHLPGVAAVFTAEELAREGLIEASQDAGARMPLAGWPEVSYVGQPVAVVVALSRYVAEDAADLVAVDYAPLPVVASIQAALAPDAPMVHPGLPGNVAVQKAATYGEVDAAFREAEIVVEEEFRIPRAAAHPLEGRGLLAVPDPATRGLTVWASTQRPHSLRAALAPFLGLPVWAVRVIAPDVGGAFGSKTFGYPEDFLIPWLAHRVGRPVRWLEDRREHFVATLHGREQLHRVRLAARRDGRLLAVDDAFWMDVGAFPSAASMMERTIATLPGPYRLPAYRATAHAVLTHKTPVGPYRGAGRPQGNYVMERMMDRLAEAVGMDPAEVRRINLIPSSAMPYTTGLDLVYDSGDYPAALDAVLATAGYRQRREEQAAARRQGRYLGIGLAAYIEDTGRAGPYEAALARLEPDGSVTIASGAPSSGQGHETTFAQVAAERLSLPIDRVRVALTDTAEIGLGIGAFGSRSAGIATGAIWEAAAGLERRLKEVAAALLEAAIDDLELVPGGAVQVKGVPSRTVTFEDVARVGATVSMEPLPPGVLPGLEVSATFRGRPQYANGVHVAVVEVDPETGQVSLRAYTVVHDCGTLLNPTIVTGQIRGGVAHGVSTVLLEELRYDEAGQLLSGTYQDYLLPTASDLPPITVEHLEYPSPFTPTGAKGAGEGGTIPALACVANAIEDALRPLGARIRELPVTPERVRALLRDTPFPP
ncbi:MAG: xanthine dehydrogenase family protein molybdopterin-binding subunit [bacterium]